MMTGNRGKIALAEPEGPVFFSAPIIPWSTTTIITASSLPAREGSDVPSRGDEIPFF
jgi:hypothetical protein